MEPRTGDDGRSIRSTLGSRRPGCGAKSLPGFLRRKELRPPSGDSVDARMPYQRPHWRPTSLGDVDESRSPCCE